jgi:sporulation integral membrane protein YtvI
MDSLINKIDLYCIFILCYTLVFMVFFATLGYTLPFILALIFAFILQKPTKFLIRKFKLKNSMAALITTIFFFTVLISLLSWGITALTQETIQLGKNTQVYISNNSNNISTVVERITNYYKNLDPTIVNAIESNLSSLYSKFSYMTAFILKSIISIFINFLSSIPYTFMVILFTLLSTYFFTKDLTSAKHKILTIIPQEKTDRLLYIFDQTKKMFGNYILSYLLIITVTFLETIIAFLILKVKYAVILSIACGILDLLPILGIGAIYIPLAIVYGLNGNIFTCLGLIACYALVTIVRQIIEPKIISSSLGIHPVAVLAALFIGLKANGISGMLFCIFFVVFFNIMRKVKVI